MIKIIIVSIVVIFSSLDVFAAACSSTIAQGSTESCNSIVQNSITWTFTQNYTVGQFVNGDYWVIDSGSGISINTISPASTTSSNTTNGSMKNPVRGTQGYDEDMYGNTYSDALNVALDVSSSSPLVLHSGDSLVSSISASPTCGPNNLAYLSDMAVLSVLSSPPASGAFRPPYSGASKPIHNISEIDYSKLRSIASSGTAPSLSTLEADFSKVWYDVGGYWGYRMNHPCNNMPDYGADMAGRISQALLSLHLNYSNTQKEKLLISLLQYAIDISSFISNGDVFEANGGHGLGRKSVLALGAMVLNDSTMQTQLNGVSQKFGEDQHTWYITSADYSRTVCGYDRVCSADKQYNSTNAPVGTAEWGRNHYSDGSFDDVRLVAPYRDYYGRQLGGLLSSIMLGAESTWNWSAAFDYIERVKPSMEAIPESGRCAIGGLHTDSYPGCFYTASEWELDMYDAYWATYRGSSPSDPTCSDSTQNGDETGVDCGGSCPACSTPPITGGTPVGAGLTQVSVGATPVTAQ